MFRTFQEVAALHPGKKKQSENNPWKSLQNDSEEKVSPYLHLPWKSVINSQNCHGRNAERWHDCSNKVRLSLWFFSCPALFQPWYSNLILSFNKIIPFNCNAIFFTLLHEQTYLSQALPIPVMILQSWKRVRQYWYGFFCAGEDITTNTIRCNTWRGWNSSRHRIQIKS